MVIGHGDIAKVLPQRKNLLFFASGVSNSQEIHRHAYAREEDLLMSQPRDEHIVYFSSLSIFYDNTLYTRHKRYMETLVKENFPTYTIMRLGNIAWGNNPHTLINYLRAHPKAEIRNEYRYLISKDEFLHWINLIPSWPCEMNCPGERLKVKEVYERFVKPYRTS